MKQIAVDSSMKKLSIEALTLQIGCAESPLASFLLVLSFYGESLGGRGFVTVLPTIVLQAPLDRARGELPSDSRTLISHWEKFRGKTGEIWRSVIANYRAKVHAYAHICYAFTYTPLPIACIGISVHEYLHRLVIIIPTLTLLRVQCQPAMLWI